jgi:hypothetical protein
MPMLNALVLVAFIKLLFVTDSPRLCAGIYTGMVALWAVIDIAAGEIHIGVAVFGLILAGGLSWVYFSMLRRLHPWTGAWWAVALGGPVVLMFFA